jgi:hypothetical protein
MLNKRVLRPERLRRVPAQFSWIDQRLIRDGHLQRCDAHALALYLLLVTVADAQGLSYYGEASLARLLSMPAAVLVQARADLIRLGLIAYACPLYQVLALDPSPPPRTPGMQSVERSLAQLQATLGSKRGGCREP